MLECGGGLAQDVITTVGQVGHLFVRCSVVRWGSYRHKFGVFGLCGVSLSIFSDLYIGVVILHTIYWLAALPFPFDKRLETQLFQAFELRFKEFLSMKKSGGRPPPLPAIPRPDDPE